MKNKRLTTWLAITGFASVIGSFGWVVAGLTDTFDPDQAPVGYVGQPTVSTHILWTGAAGVNQTRLFAIDYDATDWSGNLHSFPLTSTGSITKTDDWGTGGAAAKIDVQNPLDLTKPNARRIITWDYTATPPKKIHFRAETDDGAKDANFLLSNAQKDSINTDDAKMKKIVKWLRGNRGDEGTASDKYRIRGSVLGDIIHSTPIYCKTDCTNKATVFVGANDGMLHAIDADPAATTYGSERFAYVPSMLIPKLKDLPVHPYTHKSFVDGRMDLRKFGSQAILVGGLGAGGKGLWALNVTNPDLSTVTDVKAAEAYAKDNFLLWEITNTTSGFGNLGYTYGQPLLARIAEASGTNALIMANGYDNSGNFQASLYIIDPVTGALIHESSTTDGAASATNRNGLSSPSLVDENADGKFDTAYAGDLNGNLWKFKLSSPWTVTKLFTTSPAQPITMQPGIVEHPTGGFMVTFVTGRLLVPDDSTDTSTHVAYGIWDGAPSANNALLNQTMTERTYSGGSSAIRVRTATNNQPNWAPGDGHHYGWRTELPIGGERVVGDGAYIAGGVFLFMSHNPTITASPPVPDAENWWMQLNAYTGGDVGSIRFDLDANGAFTADDKVTVSGVPTSPVGRNMGPGRRSQLTAINAGTYTIYQSNYDKNAGEPPPPGDNGISGGHFDYDIYYWGGSLPVHSATGLNETRGPFCLKTTDVNNYLGELAPNYCKTGSPYLFKSGYGFLMTLETGAKCGDAKQPTYLQTLTCSEWTVSDTGGTSYDKRLHVHEYDDKYNVTGVNNLHPSDQEFKINTMKTLVDNPNLEFKILVLGQFMSPAALLRVGTEAERLAGTTGEVSVKTYNNLASETDPATLLTGLPIYTISAGDRQLGAFIFNLPKTAFQSKDWWGSGGDGQARAGLIPTQTGCVNGVRNTGESEMLGPQGERFNGALGFQIVKATTPPEALEMNRPGDVRYGWRVKQAYMFQYLIGEYSTFWHHFNGKCWGAAGWVQNPPQDSPTTAAAEQGDPGADDPKGLFGGPGGSTPSDPTIVSVTSTTTNGQTTTTTTYSNGTVVITYPDGSEKTTTSSGAVTWRIPGIDTGGVVNTGSGGGGTDSADPSGVRAPGEALERINWRELRR